MTPRTLSQKDAALNIELANLNVRIAEASSQILTAPVDSLEKLVSQRLELEQQKNILAKTIAEIRNQMRLEQEKEKQQEGLRERKASHAS